MRIQWNMALAWAIGAMQVHASFIADMEPPPTPGGAAVVNNLTFGELLFSTPVGFFHRDHGSGSGFPDNGSAYLSFASLMSPLVISNVTGSSFSVVQFDIAEYSTSFFTPAIPLTGAHPDGTPIALTVNLDGINDGDGPTEDFETITFDGMLTNLQWLAFEAPGYSLDNFVVASGPIPEPSTLILFFLSALGICRRLIRYRSP